MNTQHSYEKNSYCCPAPNCGLVFRRADRLFEHTKRTQYAISPAALAKYFQLIDDSGLITDKLDDHNAPEDVHINESAKSTKNPFPQDYTNLRRNLPLRPIESLSAVDTGLVDSYTLDEYGCHPQPPLSTGRDHSLDLRKASQAIESGSGHPPSDGSELVPSEHQRQHSQAPKTDFASHLPSDSGYNSGLGAVPSLVCFANSTGSSLGIPRDFLQEFITFFGDTLIDKSDA